MSSATLYALLASGLSCLLGCCITWHIMQRKVKAARWRAQQLWLGQRKLWKQYQELLKDRTQP